MENVKAVASIAILAGVGLPGVAIARRIWVNDEMAWTALVGVLVIMLVVSMTGMYLMLSRYQVFRADTEAILSQRVRTNATAEATGQPGNSAQMPWLMLPGNQPALAPPADAYSPDVLADYSAPSRNGRG